ncbi:sigma-70 family RNA polymerase sigma factor, partial [Hoylesella timonensis]
ELINRVTSQMPDQRRRIFTMSRLDGMSNEEIGHRLNISKRTVETHISQALAQIRRLLECFILFHYL